MDRAARLQIGEAVVVPQGNVGRCAVTTQNPATGLVDLDTLKALPDYRGDVETTEPLPFGIHPRSPSRGSCVSATRSHPSDSRRQWVLARGHTLHRGYRRRPM